jgi:geranylgeranyl reductase family protein
MAETLYDTIIVGAGPGGATAGYFLAEAGQRVLILEKAHPPRYKACGGGLSAHMLARIFPFSFEPVIEARVRTVTWTLGKRAVEFPVGGQAVRTVMRAQFDAFLLQNTKAEVRTGQTVRKTEELPDRARVHLVDGTTLEARYVIGADGAASGVARDLRLRRDKEMAGALEVELPARPEDLQRYGHTLLFVLLEGLGFGYGWIFPKANLLSVGVMALHPQRGQLQAALEQLARDYGLSLEGAAVKGHPIPLYLRREKIATRRGLLVGDAAGLADPLSGEGIRLAIESGQMAAQALLAGQPERYEAEVWRRIGRSQRLALVLARLVARFPNLFFALGAANPILTPVLIDVLTGRTRYGRVIVAAVATLPIYAGMELLAGIASLVGGPGSGQRVRARLYPRGNTGA